MHLAADLTVERIPAAPILAFDAQRSLQTYLERDCSRRGPAAMRWQEGHLPSGPISSSGSYVARFNRSTVTHSSSRRLSAPQQRLPAS